MADSIRFSLADGADLLGLTDEEVWWRYAALGGTLEASDLADVVAGRRSVSTLESDRAAHALNEAFLDLGVSTFPVGYQRERDAISSLNHSRVQARLLAVRRAAAVARANELRAESAALIRVSAQLQGLRWESAMAAPGSDSVAAAASGVGSPTNTH